MKAPGMLAAMLLLFGSHPTLAAGKPPVDHYWWEVVGATSTTATFIHLTSQSAAVRQFDASTYIYGHNGYVDPGQWRRQFGKVTVDCAARKVSFAFTRIERLDGKQEDMASQPPAGIHEDRVLDVGCGDKRSDHLRSLLDAESFAAISARREGIRIRPDPRFRERCVVLHPAYNENPSAPPAYELYVTKERALGSADPGKLFAEYVKARRGGVTGGKVTCDRVDPERPQTESEWLKDVLGQDARWPVVDNIWE